MALVQSFELNLQKMLKLLGKLNMNFKLPQPPLDMTIMKQYWTTLTTDRRSWHRQFLIFFNVNSWNIKIAYIPKKTIIFIINKCNILRIKWYLSQLYFSQCKMPFLFFILSFQMHHAGDLSDVKNDQSLKNMFLLLQI